MIKKHNATLRGLEKDNSKGLNHRIKLQLFAEGGNEDNDNTGDQTPPNAESKEGEEKTYTQEELDKLLQAETDKRVSQALNTAQEKWQKDFEERLKLEKEEAKKLAKMNDDEKQKHEIEKARKEIADREKAIQFKDLKFTAINILNEKGLPITLVDTLISSDLDAEKTKENIDTFENMFRAEVEKAVNERLKGKPPKSPSSTITTTTTSADEFVDIIKQNQIYNQK